jgi:HEAT repeat protein
MNAIGALALVQTPSSSNVQALAAMTSDPDNDISSSATLALGASARTLGTTDPALYQDTVGNLLTDLANAQSPQQMMLDLRALGNSGDPRVLAAAQNAMSVQDVGVRLAAVSAVRFVPGSDCDTFLTSVAENDPDESVRVQALATIQTYRSAAGFLPLFAAVLQRDGSPIVRRAALQALNTIRTNPEAASLIAAAARDDSSEDVRQYAQAILAS